MKILSRALPVAAASVLLTGFALAAPAQALTVAAANACDDPVATTIHTLHDAAGPLGEPLHAAEELYCSVAP